MEKTRLVCVFKDTLGNAMTRPIVTTYKNSESFGLIVQLDEYWTHVVLSHRIITVYREPITTIEDI